MTGDDRDSPDLELFREPETDEVRLPFVGASPNRSVPASKRLRRVIAVSGAKGGVGQTLVATNLGIYLATLGRRVVVVDADAEGANAHTFLGVARPGMIAAYSPPRPSFQRFEDWEEEPTAPGAPESLGLARAESERQARAKRAIAREEAEAQSRVIETPVPGLFLLHAGIDEPSRGSTRRARRARLVPRLRELEADDVVLDLGAGTQPALLDAWLGADIGVFVGLPEPTAIENTYRFIRFAFARQLKRGAPDRETRRSIVAHLRALDNAPAPLDLIDSLTKKNDPLVSFVRREAEKFRFRMIINQTRLRADLELGDRMRSAAWRRLGLQIDYLGYIDYDDSVWTCVRAGRPLLIETPGGKASRSLERISRRILAIEAGKSDSRRYRTVPPESHHDLLEVDRGATEEEIRRAYKRVRELYSDGSLACYGLLDSEGLSRLRIRLEEAYDVLLDPSRRRPYELSVFPAEKAPDREAPSTESAVEPPPPAPVVTPDTEFTGSLLRGVRESQGIEISDIAERSKIGTAFLVALEEDDFAKLPAAVYVRGFLTEVAKCLRLDPEQVSRTYVKRMTRYAEESR